MRKEGTLGAAALLAIAAVVGLTWQPGGRPAGEGNRPGLVRRPEPTAKTSRIELGPGCQRLEEQLQDFLETKDPIAPGECYLTPVPPANRISKELTEKTSGLKFVVALVPDPLHTHLAVLFDQFTVAVQEGAQDEKYDFDSSWLPWDNIEQSYPLLADQESAKLKKEETENQPGVLLFRRAVSCSDRIRSKYPEEQESCAEEVRRLHSGAEGTRFSKSYGQGLVIFVVGEEATYGIHKEQFRNALKWIALLNGASASENRRLGILGPTFSGSLPSLTQLLAETKTVAMLGIGIGHEPLAIYSGSVSGKDPVETFRFLNGPGIVFHSFVQNDDVILARFCDYLMRNQSYSQSDPRIAILSEDETAYGKSGVETDDDKTATSSSNPACQEGALNLYYPRDISALRGAYQTKSLFDTGGPAPPPDSQRRSLPTDLADPAGKVHDSIQSYGANQTPLVQEALLVNIVAALRDLHARYILLRGSNTLDQLFLTNFLRRMYPDARVVIFGSDLLFARERGATGLGGAMTLSTYPLFPLARDWTESASLPASDRTFSSDTAEGTYIALRTLLNANSPNAGPPDPKHCRVLGQDETPFLPAVSCGENPVPDYSPPHWMFPVHCENEQSPVTCRYEGPATWLSVIGRNRFWPVASLGVPQKTSRAGAGCTTSPAKAGQEPGRSLEMPRQMKIFLIAIAVFAAFHAWCCWAGSYTAKPGFRAYFAQTGEWRHLVLITVGSFSVWCLAIVAGWGCGAFSPGAYEFAAPAPGLYCAIFASCMALAATVASGFTAVQLSSEPKGKWLQLFLLPSGLLVAAGALFFAVLVRLDHQLGDDGRAFAYWRATHLASGVSPVIPILAIFAGLYLWFWYTLHGLALFGTERPCLPSKSSLTLKDENGLERDFLRMFSQEDAAAVIEKAGYPLSHQAAAIAIGLFLILIAAAWSLADGVPLRGLGAPSYAMFVLLLLCLSIGLQIAGAWRLYVLWEELRRLLAFLDRLPLRRTLATLRGFSWESVWKMSGNVLEVRYKVVSRQLESMNHAISALEEFAKNSIDATEVKAAQDCVGSLKAMRAAGRTFAIWYSDGYTNPRAKDLTSFVQFQTSVASATGMLLTHMLVPVWIREKHSLLMSWFKEEKDAKERKEDQTTGALPAPMPEEHIRNAEEFVSLTYLAFIQNVLGRLRTLVMSILALFLASTLGLSSYPFDPRQVLSTVLVILFLALGIVIVKVYAEMHRDATLSYVTNTRPGELGAEFWIKLSAFGFAPVLGLLTRIFPDLTEFIFSWIQPSASSLH